MLSKILVDILLMLFAISVFLSNIIYEKMKNKEKALNIVTFIMFPFSISVCQIFFTKKKKKKKKMKKKKF